MDDVLGLLAPPHACPCTPVASFAPWRVCASAEASEISRIDRHFDECGVALAGMVQHAAQLAFLHTCVAQYAENYGQMNIGVRRGTPHPPCVVRKVSKGIRGCASKRGWNRCVQRGEGGCSQRGWGRSPGFGWNCGMVVVAPVPSAVVSAGGEAHGARNPTLTRHPWCDTAHVRRPRRTARSGRSRLTGIRFISSTRRARKAACR